MTVCVCACMYVCMRVRMYVCMSTFRNILPVPTSLLIRYDTIRYTHTHTYNTVGLAPNATTICLMYQYIEPAWTKRQHRAAITAVNALAKQWRVRGRGRCAPEGLNCTLTAAAADMRG